MGLTDEEKEAARLLRTALKLKLAERSARWLLSHAGWTGAQNVRTEIKQLAEDTERMLNLVDEVEKG